MFLFILWINSNITVCTVTRELFNLYFEYTFREALNEVEEGKYL